MAKTAYDFDMSSKKRAQDQAIISAANNLEEDPTERVRVNFSLQRQAKKKMFEAAENKGISASALLQIWISENC